MHTWPLGRSWPLLLNMPSRLGFFKSLNFLVSGSAYHTDNFSSSARLWSFRHKLLPGLCRPLVGHCEQQGEFQSPWRGLESDECSADPAITLIVEGGGGRSPGHEGVFLRVKWQTQDFWSQQKQAHIDSQTHLHSLKQCGHSLFSATN